MRKLLASAAAVTLGLSLSACASDEGAEGTVEITVYAAASLKDTFTELAEEFSEQNPGWTVAFNFAGSSDLVTQIKDGAPADVFASADEVSMAKLDAAALASPAELFTTNTMTIVVPPGNPAGIDSLEDLAGEVKVVVCAVEVPCGNATNRIEEASGVDITPVSEESNVTDVLGKVVADEADAGIVYVTDAAGVGDDVETVAIDEAVNTVNNYPIAVLASSERQEVAQAFVDFVRGMVGQQILRDAGFASPAAP